MEEEGDPMFNMKIEMPKQKKFAMIPSLNLGKKNDVGKINLMK